jgi:hypothetical protein
MPSPEAAHALSLAPHLVGVSTARGSGWVDLELQRSPEVRIFVGDPPATAGGTDSVQARLLFQYASRLIVEGR